MSRVNVEIEEVPKSERERLLPVLDDSFEGIYLWHARRTLQSIEQVVAARTPDQEDAGLAMLKTLDEDAGYVYYVAVPVRFRRQGVGARLVDYALAYFMGKRVPYVYASVEEDNPESKALFGSKGFERLKGSEMAGRYGRIRSLLMYREMMVVPGEILLGRRIDAASRSA